MSQPPTRADRRSLATPVQFLKGVGPDRAELLRRLQLNTAADVLFRFPRGYLDFSQVQAIAQLEEGQPVSICGTVEEIDERTTSTGKLMMGILVRDETEYLRATWFNQPFIRKRFQRGSRIMLSGEPRRAGLRWEMVHPRIQNLEHPSGVDAGEILPVYPLTEGLKQAHMRRISRHVLDEFLEQVDEVLPEAFRDQHGLWPVHAALTQIHFPRDNESLRQARRRLVFQELLVLQLALAIRRHQLSNSQRAVPLPVTARIDARVRRLFPFDLTRGQEQAWDDIQSDLNRTVPMNRLLQGDVGSGKTVVAVCAMLAAVANGYQAALMVPTEVLARQHYQTLGKALAQARVRVALWTGGISPTERRETQARVASGDIDLVVGTQALIQGDCEFSKLGLVVIDEQHKFGVAQRAQLRDAGTAPHYLVMTATPIPRTIAMTTYGDLDVTCLRDHPPGRQPVHTYLVNEVQRASWWEFFRKQLRSGRQGYVITPRLEESEDAEVTSLKQTFEALCNDDLEAFRLDLIHGRLTASEKQAAMDAFRSGQTQVLVATSVVEVGVDVANATVMTIENGERFGLAQLHQMRGRVGRGCHAGYVGVFTGKAPGEPQPRLDALAKTSDGFELAEIDFQLRGPGDLLGTHQHGAPPLRIADLLRDEDTLLEARDVAQSIVASGRLNENAYQRLLKQVLNRYRQAFQLADVG